MKYVLPTLLASALVVGAAHAQGRPDFSGTWTMDQERSESAHQGEPIGPVTLAITQTARELTMEVTRSSGRLTLVYNLAGAESKIPGGTATAHWDGSTLVIDAVRDVNGMSVTTKESRRCRRT